MKTYKTIFTEDYISPSWGMFSPEGDDAVQKALDDFKRDIEKLHRRVKSAEMRGLYLGEYLDEVREFGSDLKKSVYRKHPEVKDTMVKQDIGEYIINIAHKHLNEGPWSNEEDEIYGAFTDGLL